MQNTKSPFSLSSTKIQIVFLILFFFSGACGLIYEVAWTRMLRIVFGNTTFAVSTILTSFMAGLTLGSYFFGRFADNHRSPLLIYGLQELGIGAFALIYPTLLPFITKLYIPFYQQLNNSFYLFNLVRFLICFALLIIPAFLMGGTLPVMGKLFIKNKTKIGWGTGILYGSNTFGAVFGCVGAGFFLLSELGVNETTYLAGAINLMIGGCALFLNRITFRTVKEEEGEEEEEPGKVPAYSNRVLNSLLLVYFLSGYCALAYEVLWTRILVFFLGSTIYAFTIMLATFLCGLSLGSLVFSYFTDRHTFSITTLGILEMLIGVLGVVSLLQFGLLHGLIDRLLGTSWESWVGAVYAGCFFIMFIPTFLMGMTFPLINKIYIRGMKMVGKGVGTLYSLNTLGCIFGSFTAGFILIPLLGITKTVVVIALINVVIGAVTIGINPYALARSKWLAVTGVLLVLVFTFVVVPFDKPAFLYRSSLRKLGNLLYSKEGAIATVTVHRSSPDPFTGKEVKAVYIDGVNVAGTSQMLRTTQKLQAHLPVLLFKSSSKEMPRSVFIVGFGSGNSSYEVSLHGVKVYCGELISDLTRTASYFSTMNHNITENPDFHFLNGDARTILMASTGSYDVIESDSIHPEINFDLYTREYFQICKSRLTPHGIVSTWIPLFKLSNEDFKMILNTFQSVFPHTSLWYAPIYLNDHALLIGSNEELKVDFMRLEEELQSEEIRETLKEVGLDDVFKLLNCFMIGEEDIARYVEGSLINTSNHPYVAFYAPKSSRMNRESLENLLKFRKSVFPLLVNTGDREDEIGTRIEKDFRSAGHVIKGIINNWYGLSDLEFDEYQRALEIDPENSGAQSLLSKLMHDSFIMKGNAYKEKGEHQLAISMFKNALRVNPRSLWSHNNLAAVYDSMENYDEAIRESLKALEIDPYCAIAHYNLAFAYGSQGLLEKCRESLEEALRLDPDMKAARDELKRLKKFANLH